MSKILNINTQLKPTYDEWNKDKQCVGFIKGTQIQGCNTPYGAYGNGKDVAKNLIANYGYVDLKCGLKRGCVVSLGATDTNQYGHVVMINDMDGTHVWVAEGNYDGKNSGNFRTAYQQTIADFKKRNGGIVGTAIHPSWNTSEPSEPTSTSKISKYKRDKTPDNGYYKIDEKHMNGLVVKGTVNDSVSCEFSTDDKSYVKTTVCGTTTMQSKVTSSTSTKYTPKVGDKVKMIYAAAFKGKSKTIEPSSAWQYDATFYVADVDGQYALLDNQQKDTDKMYTGWMDAKYLKKQ